MSYADKREYLMERLEEYYNNIKFINTEGKNIYVDGEFDSNQTRYEKLSNSCKIGILASNWNEAKILSVFLRIYIDQIWNYIDYLEDDMMDKDEKVEETVYEYIIHMDFPYMEKHEINKDIKVELYSTFGTIEITSEYENIEKFDYECIKKLYTSEKWEKVCENDY